MLRFLSRIFLVTFIFAGIGNFLGNIYEGIFLDPPNAGNFIKVRKVTIVNDTCEGVKQVDIKMLENDPKQKTFRFQVN